MFIEWRIARLEKKLKSAREDQEIEKALMLFHLTIPPDEFIAATKRCGRLENKIRKLKAKL